MDDGEVVVEEGVSSEPGAAGVGLGGAGGSSGGSAGGDVTVNRMTVSDALNIEDGEPDPDIIRELEMEEISLGRSSVYNSCSIEIQEEEVGGSGDKARNIEDFCIRNKILKSKKTGEVWRFRKSKEKIPDSSGSNWSFTKMIRDRFLTCCKSTDAPDVDIDIEKAEPELQEIGARDSEPGVNEENQIEVGLLNENVANSSDQAPEPSPGPSNLGSLWIIDCNESAKNIQANFKRFWFASGKLVIKNSPISSAMDMLNKPQPSLLSNVKCLHFENCDLSIEDLCSILEKLRRIEEIRIQAKVDPANKNTHLFRTHLMKDFQDSREDKDYFSILRERFGNTMDEHLPQRLLSLSILMPMTWQCNLIYKAVEAVMNGARFEVLVIQSSLCDMLEFLVDPENKIEIENETSWENLVKLDCCQALRRSRSCLRELSLSCGNRFPLDHLKIARMTNASIEDVFRWSFYITVGILNAFELQEMKVVSGSETANDSGDSDVFPMLSRLNFDLPLVPVPLARDDYFQCSLKVLMPFLAHNNHIQQVTLNGLRPEKGMENWIKQSLASLSKNGIKIGCTYRSTTLGKNLEAYDDDLVSLGLTIDPEETRNRVSQIIEPNGTEEQLRNPTWRYARVKCLHIVNQLRNLISFDVARIAPKFDRLTKLVIEDFAMGGVTGNGSGDCSEDNTRKRPLADSDMQTIFKTLLFLEYLHLDCNMSAVTDNGLTGIGDRIWSRLSQRKKVYSFWHLHFLKYVFLRGLGDKVTDKSAIYAFSEYYSLASLMELYLFAPGMTNYGKQKIRDAFAGRSGFILEV